MHVTRTTLVLLTLAVAACQSTSPLAGSAGPQAAHVLTEAEVAARTAPVGFDKTLVLSLEHPQDATGGPDTGTRGADMVPVEVTTAGLHRFELSDENGEAHGLRLLDAAGGEVLAISGEGMVEKQLAAGSYVLELRHSGQGQNLERQTAFIHPVAAAGGARGVVVSLNHCTGCDLSGAKLTNASFRNVVFLGSDLSGADLRGADLEGAFFGATSLEGANTAGTRFSQDQAVGAGTPAVTRGWEEREDATIYEVVMNHEEQFSIWPADRELPLGWCKIGFSGLKPQVLDHIEQIWVDMRPLSLRKKMEEAGYSEPIPPAARCVG